MTYIYVLTSALYGTSKRLVILNFPVDNQIVEDMVNKTARLQNQKGDWTISEVKGDW